MEKAERETHDFMNVESFSQLPFIRPAPLVKEKGSFRLFGKEFGNGTTTATTDESESGETNTCHEEAKDGGGENGESSRKFECHYCCRNFPTSQALGGHQNAHKRERQHAKRVHLQSTAMAQGGFTDAHLYYRLSSATAPPPPSMTYHPSWNNNINSSTYPTTPRFYGNHGSYPHPPPVNGSPLALWRIPTVQSSSSFNHDRALHHPLPLLGTDEFKPSQVIGGSTSQSRYVYEPKPSLQDHVSLDLHL